MELFHTDTDYSTLILGVFLLDQIALVGVSPSLSLKLFGREITWSSRTDRQTDGRTDRHRYA